MLARIQNQFQAVSGLPADRYTSTIYAEGAALDTAIATALATAFKAFWTSGTTSVASWMGPASRFSAGVTNRIEVFDMADAEPRVPLYSNVYAQPTWAAAGVGVPEEVALCLSFQANPVSGLPQARRRGRFFVGPFSSTALAAAPAIRPQAGLMASMIAASVTLAAAIRATGMRWVVYSPTNKALGALATSNVDVAWVDNAWDTMRSRGGTADNRTISAAL